MLPIYDLYPVSHDNYVAPSATVTGEVYLDRFVSVWYNAVIKGDMNQIDIMAYTSIGDGTVI